MWPNQKPIVFRLVTRARWTLGVTKKKAAEKPRCTAWNHDVLCQDCYFSNLASVSNKVLQTFLFITNHSICSKLHCTQKQLQIM